MRDREPIDRSSKPKQTHQQDFKEQSKKHGKFVAAVLRYAWPVLIKFFPALGAFSAIVYFILWIIELF
jgi:hypothetical protein